MFLAMVTSFVAAQVTKTITNLVAGTLRTTLNATEKKPLQTLPLQEILMPVM